ncbi:MAG: hypothetical protein CMP22_02680 [Rickettsiales bacterium]|nr:hypothetical protein [Rickettsiales bacterium]|tara:strand:- start:744 stop:1343 length:600 start_codon:yes stop_codon:yes gene_type:complete
MFKTKSYLNSFIILCAVFLTVSCASDTQSVWQKPEMTFSYINDPVMLDIAQSYVSSKASSDIYTDENGMVRYPLLKNEENVLARLVNNRVRPTGGANVLSLTIERSDVIEKPIEPEDGLEAMFTIQNSQVLDAYLTVFVELLDPNNRPLQAHRVQVKRKVSIPSNASLNEKNKIVFELSEAVLKDFDQKFTEILKRHYF